MLHLDGGAAVAFTGNRLRMTLDVDASYKSVIEVKRAVEQIAKERNLPANWLNSSAKAFIPAGATWTRVDLGDGIQIQVASPETLLAMKLSASRDRDIQDIGYLVRALGITKVQDATRIAEEMYGDDDVAYSKMSREDAPIVVQEALDAVRQMED